MSKWANPTPHIDLPEDHKHGCNRDFSCAGQFMVDRGCPRRGCKGVVKVLGLCTGRGMVFVPNGACETCGTVLRGYTMEARKDV